MTDLTTNIPWIRDISVAGTDGRIKCSTNRVAIGLNVSDRAHFQDALNTREFALSDYVIGHLKQAPSLVAGFPIITEDGAVNGVVLAVINLQWIGDLQRLRRNIPVRRLCCSTAAAHSLPPRPTSSPSSAGASPMRLWRRSCSPTTTAR